jgi:fatty acid omega-hydroxylase
MLLCFAFDNICAAAFAVEAGCLVDGLPNVSFAREFERATELSLTCFYTTPFIWEPKQLLSVGTERALVEAARAMRELAERTVADRRTELRKVGDLAGRCDLLSRLMLSTPHPAAATSPAAERVVACRPREREERPRAAVLAGHGREKRAETQGRFRRFL